MFLRSIRWRLQCFYGLILCLVLAGFGFSAYGLMRESAFRSIDAGLQQKMTLIASGTRPGPSGGFSPRGGGRDHSPKRRPDDPSNGGFEHEIRLSPETLAEFDWDGTRGLYFMVWAPGGQVLARSRSVPSDLPAPPAEEAEMVEPAETRGTLREITYVSPRGRRVMVGRSIAVEQAQLRRTGWWLGAAGGAVLLLGLGGGWWATTSAIRPIDQISAAAAGISAGNLKGRVNVKDTDTELGRLAEILNTMFARLEKAFAQQRQFTADASHELRTPLAALIAEAQATLSRPRTGGEYEASLHECLETAQRMRRLTESLLDLARLDAEAEPSRHETFELGPVVESALNTLRPLAAEQHVAMQSRLDPVFVRGAPSQWTRIALNLGANAIRYNRKGGQFQARVFSQGGQAVLEVSDNGMGIAEEDLPRIFDRFYRADKSRSRAEGSHGLGLAICKAIVEAHGGTIEAASQLGGGTTVSVRVPAASATGEPSPSAATSGG